MRLPDLTKIFRRMTGRFSDVPWRDEVVTNQITVENGYVLPCDKPGFGVEVNEAEAAKHPFQQLPAIGMATDQWRIGKKERMEKKWNNQKHY